MEGYITVLQAAKKWEVTPRQVQLWCKAGKVYGAQKWNRDWAIPDNSERPVLKRNRSATRHNATKK